MVAVPLVRIGGGWGELNGKKKDTFPVLYGHGKDDGADSRNSAATPATLAVIVTVVQRVLDAMTRGGV